MRTEKPYHLQSFYEPLGERIKEHLFFMLIVIAAYGVYRITLWVFQRLTEKYIHFGEQGREDILQQGKADLQSSL